jgi:hypothetical protein
MSNQTATTPVTRTVIAKHRHVSYEDFAAASVGGTSQAKPSGWSDELWDDVQCGRISYRRAAATNQNAESVVATYLAGSTETVPLDRIELVLICRNAADRARELPDFKPADEPDLYRDAWESLTDPQDAPNWIMERVSSLAPANPDLARRILALLSEADDQ